MRLIILTAITLFLTIANAMVVHKNKDGIIPEDDHVFPTPTSKEPSTKVKRAKITEFHDNFNITIFQEGWSEWDQDWFESSWTVPEGEKVFDGVIMVELTNNAGFSLQSQTLQSQYGFIEFDFKLSVSDGSVRLNFISFDENDYVNQAVFDYSGTEYIHVRQKIMNHSKGTFISNIRRFAWQNYGNEKDFILYLKNIVYNDILVDISKYDRPVSLVDHDKCELNSQWTDISVAKNRISFGKEDGQCVMKMTTSPENPVIFELNDRQFTGGKLDLEIRSENDPNSILIWFGVNSEDPNIEEIENGTSSITNEKQIISSEDFDTDDYYNAIKLATVEGETTYIITNFIFSPIIPDDIAPSFDVTFIEEPDVIIDSQGFYWTDASWGSTFCNFLNFENAMVCSFEGRQGSWPGFAFSTINDYNGGTLVVTMKVLNPDQSINILAFQRGEICHSIDNFKATTEYKDYSFEIPKFDDNPTFKYSIQEATQQDNTYYIKKLVYYPPYISPITGEKINTKINKSTTTTSIISEPTKTESSFQPTNNEFSVKTEEENLEDLGYKVCSPKTRIAFADGDNIYGLENDEWCVILEKNIDSCWSVLYGYQCCSEKATISGAWGIEEDKTKCGNPSENVCWASYINSELECCTIKESEMGIVVIDEDGAWGIKNDKWCGIK